MKKNNLLDIDIKRITNENIITFNNRLPSAEVLINTFKNIKVPFRSNNLNISIIINKIMKNKNFIISKFSEIALPDVKITLNIFKQTLIFNSLRDKLYYLFNYDLNHFNKIIKEISSELKNLDIDYFYIKTVKDYQIIDSEIIKLLPADIDIDIFKHNNINFAMGIIKKIPKEYYEKALRIIDKNYSIYLSIEEIRDTILPSIKNQIISTSIPNLNIGNIYFDSFFNNKKFSSKTISNITENNIKNYHQIMISLLKSIEHSLNLVDKGPGMHFLYNCFAYYLQILKDVYHQISIDNYSFNIFIDKEFIETYNNFISLSEKDFLKSKDFNNFCSLLTGELSTSIFTRDTSDIKDFRSPYHNSKILTNDFVKTSFNILNFLVNKKEISLIDILNIYKKYNMFFDDINFFIEDINDINIQLENSSFERKEYLDNVLIENKIKFFNPLLDIVKGIKDLMVNVNIFNDEYLTKDGRIVSYDSYLKYKDNYLFYNNKSHLKIMMNYFYQLFDDLIVEDDKSYTKDILNNILDFFERFNEGMNRISNIEKNTKK